MDLRDDRHMRKGVEKLKTELSADASADGSLSQALSIMDVQTNRQKRMWLKSISFFVAFTFLVQQATYADIYSYKRLGGIAENLLPSAKEQEQAYQYAPSYLNRQQQKHEELIRQKMGKEDLIGQLATRQKRPQEDMPLKKKKSGASGSKTPDYTLTEPDDIDDPHEYNDLEYEENDALDRIDTFDITRNPEINVDSWKQGAEQKQDEKTGLDYWIGFEEYANEKPGIDRQIKEVIYFGDKESEKIKKLYSGYRKEKGTEEYKPKYRTEYEYENDAVS